MSPHTVNLINLINPAQEIKVEMALFKLAQRNAFLDVAAPIALAPVVAIGFSNTLDEQGLTTWLLLMLCSIPTGLLTYWILHPKDKHAEPTTARLHLWRKINLLSLFVGGVAWGGIGFLFDPVHIVQNSVFLLMFLTTITVGGNTFGVHSHRAYFLMVAIASMPFILMNLSKGFGEYAFPTAVLITIYFFFHVKLALNAKRNFLQILELQFQNEQLLQEKAIAMQAAERERIYRDLHDDVGAKLLGLVISAQRANQPREADLARSALQDLRDVVSRSVQTEICLDNLLADWRVETQQRLDAAGLTLNWRIATAQHVLPVNTAAALNISRILRESVSNVLRHARASHLNVDLAWHAHKLVFTLQDDGVGLPDAGITGNRGMNSMRTRASALGGMIQWESLTPRGCRVTLEVAVSHLNPPMALPH